VRGVPVVSIGVLVAILCVGVADSASQRVSRPGDALPGAGDASFSKLPIHFVENRGVYPDEEVAYYVRGADKTLFFTRDGITFRLEGKNRAWVVKLEFVGANPEIVPRGEDRQQAVFSYFHGPEKDWKTGLRTYARVVYENLWPGIDLVYQGTVNRLKYEFRVDPGADPGRIELRYHGATVSAVTPAGGLRVETPVGCFEDEPPVAWQDVDGERVPVDVAFQSAIRAAGEGGGRVGFRVGMYDRTRPLILDPAVLVYCGYIGGSDFDEAMGVAADSAGNVYVAGRANSAKGTFPVAVGPDLTYNGSQDAFIAKLSADGRTLSYCGYIGGAGRDEALGVAVDRAGHAYLVGTTTSNELVLPVKGGPDLTFNGGTDVFVAEVDSRGTGLVYCGYIGGAGNELGWDIAIDAAGNAYVTGCTDSRETSFPVRLGPDLTLNGGLDAFVAKVSAGGKSLSYCGYIGGANWDFGYGIAVDAGGYAYVTGQTHSTEATFPVKVGPDLSYNGATASPQSGDAFVAKVDASGRALVYCGYIGGSAQDDGMGIAVDGLGSAYVTGSSASSEATFPVTVGPDLTHNGSVDAFLAKVNPSGSALVRCGYIGGSGTDTGYAVALDALGNAHVTGMTSSTEATFPVALGPDLTFNAAFPAWTDAFVASVNPAGTALVYCGYIGGADSEIGRDIAADPSGNAYVVGRTGSSESTFPVRGGPALVFGGYYDGFAAKVTLSALLTASGTTRPGGRVDFSLTTHQDTALRYQLGTSLGAGSIPIDTRTLGLSPDSLLIITLNDYWPSVFTGYRGVIDAKGQARAAIHIPGAPVLIGVRLHTAFVTLDPAAPSGIRSISNTFSFSITK